MFEKPKKEELQKSREWNGSNWHWCGVDTGGHCEAYRIHTGNGCEGKSFNARKKRGNDEPKTKNYEKQPTKKYAPSTTKKPNFKPLKLAKALAATVVEQDHDSDSDTS